MAASMLTVTTAVESQDVVTLLAVGPGRRGRSGG
jgi:hypothetical protein